MAGAILTLYVQAQLDQRETKRDVLRRFAGNRHVLATGGPQPPPSGEPFVALNEAFVVFADDPTVLTALEDLRRGARSSEDIVALIKRMATAARVPIPLDDAFLGEPFFYNSHAR